MAKRNDRIEALLTKLSEDVTAVRIQLGTARRPAEGRRDDFLSDHAASAH